ncbi:MAG: hypothetical protein GY850_13195 [bacterium]|nr:hypothetical protein [bacterium]
MSNILIFTTWYGVVQLMGIITFPLCWRIFANLPDRGYTFAKSLGILLAGFMLWFGTSYEVLRNDSFNAWLVLALLALISFTLGLQVFRPQRPNVHLLGSWVRSKKSLILACELLFLMGFVFWTIVRAHDPAVDHTEQPMDLMFMNGVWTSPNYPPHDPWLSGYAISYYYFGYWLLTTLGRLTHQPPEISYNIGQACWFGLLLLGTFGIGYNLLAAGKCQDSCDSSFKQSSVISVGKNATAIVGGFLTSLMVVLASNFHGVWIFSQNWKESRHWWWWPSSRVIQDTDISGGSIEVITEFPIFSYMLGDNHPHMMAMPFVVLTTAFCLNLFLSGPSQKTVADEFPVKRIRLRNLICTGLGRIVAIIPGKWPGLIVTAITCGALMALNTWDFPACLLLLILSFFSVIRRSTIDNGSQIRQSPYTTTALFTTILIVLVFGIYFPYLLTAQSQFAGFVPNLLHPTRPHHFFLMFGSFFIGLFLLVHFSWKTLRPSRGALLSAIGAVLTIPHLFLWGYVLWALWRDPMRLGPPFPDDLPVLAVLKISLGRWLRHPLMFLGVGSCLAVVIAIVGNHWRTVVEMRETKGSAFENSSDATRHGLSPGLCFALCTAGIGLFLVYLPEFVYLHDVFGTRMNTIFKFYYQAWLFGGIGSAYATMLSLQYRRYAVPGVLSVLLIMATLVYGAGAIYHKAGAFSSRPASLNGLAHLKKNSPEEFAAVRWIQENTPLAAVVLEGEGEGYNTLSNRISTFTGRATLLGWTGHEVQWRGKSYARMASGRSQIIAAVYNPTSGEALSEALTGGHIDYVYLGPWERKRYAVTEHHEAILAETMDVVFESKSVRVFKP